MYGVFAVLWCSGAAWLVLRYLLRPTSEFGELPNPLEAWSLRVHGAAAFATLWLLGMLWAIHLAPAWKARRRTSGIVLGAIAGLLVLSGYLLYYAGGDAVREWVAWLHWGIGLALPLPLLVHALRGRTARDSQRATDTDCG